MFGQFFSKKPTAPNLPKAPEALGLFLGGSLRLDPLKLRVVQPHLIIEGAASDQLIQAVGHIQIDANSHILRFYTDDDGFLQVHLSGSLQHHQVSDVTLWYFYETQSVGNDWEDILAHRISQPSTQLEGFRFERAWQSAGTHCPPVAFTENTYHLDGRVSQTDQFVMLYQRPAADSVDEYLTLTAEERQEGQTLERCVVISTGFNLQPADILDIR